MSTGVIFVTSGDAIYDEEVLLSFLTAHQHN